jgi:DNA polymerase I-like protein with 3'-5' exonuclease and polymerase domains
LTELSRICEEQKIEISINHIPSDEFKGQTVSLDVEHDESGGFVGCGLLVAESNRVYYFSDLSVLDCCSFTSLSIIAHNGKSDFECLNTWGLNINEEQLIWDTELIGHLLDSSLKAYGLKAMAERELGLLYPSYDDIVGRKTKKQIKERRTLDKWPVEIVSKYNALDCYATQKLYEKQKALCQRF